MLYYHYFLQIRYSVIILLYVTIVYIVKQNVHVKWMKFINKFQYIWRERRGRGWASWGIIDSCYYEVSFVKDSFSSTFIFRQPNAFPLQWIFKKADSWLKTGIFMKRTKNITNWIKCKKPTTPGIPRRSPIQVLTGPYAAWLRWSDENRYIQHGMVVGEIMLKVILFKFENPKWRHRCFPTMLSTVEFDSALAAQCAGRTRSEISAFWFCFTHQCIQYPIWNIDRRLFKSRFHYCGIIFRNRSHVLGL